MPALDNHHLDPAPLLYHELSEWYPWLTPVEDYAEEAAFYLRLFETHGQRPPRTLLDLGCGAGHNAAHLKARLACTLVDREPAMLDLSRRLNPECEHVQGDLRSLRLSRQFDCVLLHDAVNYMVTRVQLGRALATAFSHTAPGGVALFQPDFVTETFEPGTDTGGSDAAGRGLRYLEWRWVPEHSHESYVADMAYMLRTEDGQVRTVADRHVMGLFPRAVWLELLTAAGFEAVTVPFEHSLYRDSQHEVFVGRRGS